MEQSKALNTLIESSDLVRMIEEVLAMNPERLAATVPGMRLTLRGVRERILASHDVLARGLIANARPNSANASSSAPHTSGVTSEGTIRTLVQGHSETPPQSAEAAAQFKRSLRAQIERAAEK